MPRLDIVWRRLLVGGATCDHCAETGQAVVEAASILRQELAPNGIAVTLTEEALDPFSLAQSNMILFNGETVESLLGATTTACHCDSCSDMLGQPVACRSLLLDGQLMSAIPLARILDAGRIAASRLVAARG